MASTYMRRCTIAPSFVRRREALSPLPLLPPPPSPKRRRRAAAVAVAAAAAPRDAPLPSPSSSALAGLTVVPYRDRGLHGAGGSNSNGDPTSAEAATLPPPPPLGGSSPADNNAAAAAPCPPADLPFHLWHTDAALMAGCEPCRGPRASPASHRRLRVAVLLSGGVDSSVALRLAQAAGHEVEAFYLQIWFEEDFRNTWDACPWEEDLEYARAVAAGGDGAGGGGGLRAEAAGAAAGATLTADAAAAAGAAVDGSSSPSSSDSNNSNNKSSNSDSDSGLLPPAVPLTVVPLTRDYWRRVVRESVGEIRRGRTPNPDVLCNSRVKFGAFCEYLERERPGEFDRVASGHYARLLRAGEGGAAAAGGEAAGGEGAAAAAADAAAAAAAASWAVRAGARPGEPVLALTPDAVKDQTYFLAALSRAQVARAMFPIAALPKARVRALAAAARLPTTARPDSQGICFLGKVRFPEFVREHLGAWPGLLVAVEDEEEEEEEGGDEEEQGAAAASAPRRQQQQEQHGRRRRRRRVVVGGHEGYWFFTVGQRAGIRLPGGPWYVSRKDPRLNLVEVSRSRPHQRAAEEEEGGSGARSSPSASPASSSSCFFCGPINWLSSARPQVADDDPSLPPLLVKVRHGPNTHAVAAFEEVAAAGGGGDGGGGGGGGGRGGGAESEAEAKALGRNRPTEEERALAEAELAALAAAEAAAAADEHQQQGLAGAAATVAAATAAAARSVEPPSPAAPLFARVRLAGRDQGLAAGQYAVFYQGGVCLGSAKMLAAR